MIRVKIPNAFASLPILALTAKALACAFFGFLCLIHVFSSCGSGDGAGDEHLRAAFCWKAWALHVC